MFLNTYILHQSKNVLVGTNFNFLIRTLLWFLKLKFKLEVSCFKKFEGESTKFSITSVKMFKYLS